MAKTDDIKALTTRLENAARFEGVSLAELIYWPDRELMGTPNLGRKSIALAKRLRAHCALWFWSCDSAAR
jgi:DNA-directed RNA polymerase alpha subunit